jgi:hypothetical protein
MKVKPNINAVEVHPQLSNNGHPVDGALVHCGRMSLEFSVYRWALRFAIHPARTAGRPVVRNRAKFFVVNSAFEHKRSQVLLFPKI